MTDGMDRPTKHGLRRPPNDGARRPMPKLASTTVADAVHALAAANPEFPVDFIQRLVTICVDGTAREHRRGVLDGLRKATVLVCPNLCGKRADKPRRDDRWGWLHYDNRHCECPAGNIHDEIARLEKERR